MRLCLRALVCALVALAACRRPASDPPHPSAWTTSFWFWKGSSSAVPVLGGPIDSLYVHAGTLDKSSLRETWHVFGEVPDSLPAARAYWLVLRSERREPPPVESAPTLAAEIRPLLEQARRRKLNVVGVQLDMDMPTGSLRAYARFLVAYRQALPAGTQISVTALLDWLRPHTAMQAVADAADEFVPQFYDVQIPELSRRGITIAAPFQAERWRQTLQSYRRPFRIGLSTFGRVRQISAARRRTGELGVALATDLTPIDLSHDSAFERHLQRTPAGELRIRYLATRAARLGDRWFQPGDGVEFQLPTLTAVQQAVAEVRRLGGYCAGVAFFRWPAADEFLALPPDEVLQSIGAKQAAPSPRTALDAVDRRCSAVACTDLYLRPARRMAPVELRYRIRSSVPLEYFVPDERIPVRMAGSTLLALTLPSYAGPDRIPLGRAVTAQPAAFTVEEVQP